MKQVLLLLSFSAAASLSAQTTIVNSISDLSFSYSGGTSEASSGAGTLGIQTAKNSSALASLPNTYQLDVGESMTVTFDMALSNEFTGTGTANSFNISFNDNPEYYQVKVNPVLSNNNDLVNNIVFAEDGDNNLGKFNADATFGTSTHTFTFEIQRTGADEMSLSFVSPTISSTERTVTNDVTPISTTFSQFEFSFSSDVWNEDFGGSTNVANISNFSIETTGSVIPEPSTYAMIAGAMVLGLCALRRRK